MSLKKLFNLETKNTATLPDEYFAILQKQEHHNQIVGKLQILNKINHNLIQSFATIKTSILQLIDNFFQNNQKELVKNVHFFIIDSYNQILQFCVTNEENIEKKLQIYDFAIKELNQQFKEQSEDVQHYRKKLDSIKKGGNSRQQKQRFERNVQKKQAIQEDCENTRKLLLQNYQSFKQQSVECLKNIPLKTILKFIETTIRSSNSITKAIEQQKSLKRSLKKRSSIISSVISELTDSCEKNVLSEYSESDFNQCQQTNKNFSLRRSSERWKNKMSQRYEKGPVHTFVLRNSRKNSIKMKSSNLHKHKTTQQIIQEIKTFFQQQRQLTQIKSDKTIPLQDAFVDILPPLEHKQKLKKVFASLTNKYSNPKFQFKVDTNKNTYQNHQQKHKHQLTFYLGKDQFNNKHKLFSQQKDNKQKKIHLKHQYTLNEPFEEDLNSQNSNSQGNNSNSNKGFEQNKILEFEEKNNNSKSVRQVKKYPPKSQKKQNQVKQSSLNIASKLKNYKSQQFQIFQSKQKKKDQSFSSNNKIQSFSQQQKSPKIPHPNPHPKILQKQQKFKQQHKKKIIEHLFAFSTLNNLPNSAETTNVQSLKSNKYKYKEVVHSFSTNNLPQLSDIYQTAKVQQPSAIFNRPKKQVKFQQKSQRKVVNNKQQTKSNSQEVFSEKKLDFSIFQTMFG